MKAKKIASIALTVLPTLMMVFSSVLKFMAAPKVVDGLTQIGFLPYFPLPALALLEMTCAVLFLIPGTWRLGFFLVCSYLGGATAIEIAGHHPNVAPLLLTLIWIGVYLKDKSLFTTTLDK